MTEGTTEPELKLVVQEKPEEPKPEASVWRLGHRGVLLSSVREKDVDMLLDGDKEAIFFYAELTVDVI